MKHEGPHDGTSRSLSREVQGQGRFYLGGIASELCSCIAQLADSRCCSRLCLLHVTSDKASLYFFPIF